MLGSVLSINTSKVQQSLISDRWLFYVACPISALFVVHVGNENSLIQLLRLPSYYSDLLVALLCSYAIGWYLKKVFVSGHLRFGWPTALRKWIIWQLVNGIVLPLLFIALVEIIYLTTCLDISLKDSSLIYLELPVAGAALSVINLVFILLYYREHYQSLLQLKAGQAETIINKVIPTIYKTSFLVYSGNTALNIPVAEIAYFVIYNKITFLVTQDGHKYMYSESLENVMATIDPHLFFQLSRQMIANRKAIEGFTITETRKLSITVVPEASHELFVAKARASQFIKWLQSTNTETA